MYGLDFVCDLALHFYDPILASPRVALSLSLADTFLQAVEHRNGNILRANWKLWMLIIRWVDDILMMLICLDTTNVGIDLRCSTQ